MFSNNYNLLPNRYLEDKSYSLDNIYANKVRINSREFSCSLSEIYVVIHCDSIYFENRNFDYNDYQTRNMLECDLSDVAREEIPMYKGILNSYKREYPNDTINYKIKSIRFYVDNLHSYSFSINIE